MDENALVILPGGNISEPDGSDGLVFSSLRLLGNLRRALLVWREIPLCVDGTYKLHNGNWVLMTVLTITLRKNERQQIVTSARPIAFCFTRVESAASFAKLLNAVKGAGRRVFVHSLALINAFREYGHAFRAAFAGCSSILT